MPSDQDIFFRLLFGGLLPYWLISLGVLGGAVLVGRALRSGWRHRGLEAGTLYCASCRFNLRGCASWNCPECGAHLDEGYVMTPGHDAPAGLASRVLLATLLIAGPLIGVAAVVLSVLPCNYQTDRRLQLSPVSQAVSSERVEVLAIDESAWWGRGTPSHITLRTPRNGSTDPDRRIVRWFKTPLPDRDDELLADPLWNRLVKRYQWGRQSEAWRRQARTDLVKVLRYAANEAPGSAPRPSHFRVYEAAQAHLEPRLPVVLLVVVLLGGVWFWAMRSVVRWHDRVYDGYATRHMLLVESLGEWIDENREASGMGPLTGEERRGQ